MLLEVCLKNRVRHNQVVWIIDNAFILVKRQGERGQFKSKLAFSTSGFKIDLLLRRFT